MSCKPTLYKTGVYEIVNIITNEMYIGSASRIGKSSSLSGFYVRFKKHKHYLQNNTHYNTHLQRAWNKYGESNFKFNILVTCPKEYCIKLEQWFIDNLKPEYNIRLKADSNIGIKFSDEHKKKLSESIKTALSNKKERRLSKNTILNESQVKIIKYRLENKESIRSIAKDFPVTHNTIYKIRNNKHYTL
jgi:group I intron endonuclease